MIQLSDSMINVNEGLSLISAVIPMLNSECDDELPDLLISLLSGRGKKMARCALSGHCHRTLVETKVDLTQGKHSWSRCCELSVLDLGPDQLCQKPSVFFLSAYPSSAQASGQGLGYSCAFKCFSISVAAVATHSANMNSF